MIDIKTLIREKPVLFDGAMGTSIQNLGLENIDPPELLNIMHPEKLEEIHKNYIDAGAMVIETNTFGGTRPRLKLTNTENKIEQLNSAAVKIAKEIAKGKVLVAGSVGPTGTLIEPYGDTPREKVRDYFAEQIDILISAGVDLILIETMISLDEALAALEAAKSAGSKTTGVTMTFDVSQQGIFTSFGNSPEEVCNALEENGADFIGSNCGEGFDAMLKVARAIRLQTELPVLIQPNAGLPVVKNGKLIYEETPEQFASFVKTILELGIEFIGGCCGTTYKHIEKASELIKLY